MEDLYKRDPAPLRLISLVVLVVLGVVCLFASFPLWVLCFWCAGVMIYYSIAEPENIAALQQDGRDRQAAEKQNRFIDALYSGGVIDDDTTQDDIEITSPQPLVFDVELRQAGKTEAALRRAAEDSLNAMACVAVECRRTAPSRYRVAFSEQMPAERLAAMSCCYADLLERCEK